MAESRKRKRFNALDGRATTLVKQASELATLCGSPGCIVIYNPSDVSRPWRVWPDKEADFRSAIQIYKKSTKIRPHTAQKSNPSRRRKKPTVGNFGPSTSSLSSSSLSRGSTSTDLSGVNEFLTPKLTPMWMDPTTGQASFDYGNVSTMTTTTPEQADSVLAGKVEPWAGKEGALMGSEAGKALAVENADDVVIHSSIATTSSSADDVGIHSSFASTSSAADVGIHSSFASTSSANDVGIHSSFASTSFADDVELHSLIATSSSAADTINADADDVGIHTIATAGELSDDIFDLDELLNMSDDEWISYCNSQQ